MKNRVCVLATPRSGSQLCENIIRDRTGAMDLGEYFEAWVENKYEVINGTLTLVDRKTVNTAFAINNDYLNRLSILEKTNPSQPIVLRLFLLQQYKKETLSTIIQGLHSLNFDFVCLERKHKVDQLLSYLIALHYNLNLKTDVFAINSRIDIPVKLDIPFTKKIINMLYPSLINFSNNVKQLLGDIPKHDVEYSTILEDLGALYNTEFNPSGIKSIEGDPFDLITNKEELIALLKEYNIPLNGK